jgi:hypothetical protein
MPKLRWKKNVVVAYHNVWNSPDGKVVLEDLEKRAPLLRSGLNGATVDVNMLLVLEGQSNVIKHIYKMLKRDPNEPMPDKATNEPMIV